MDISSTQNTDVTSVQGDALKKSVEVIEKDALKVIENANEQSKQTTAQKTGVGSNINLIG